MYPLPALVAFDLDGTLAESKQPLSSDMGALLGRLLERMPVAVMSGAGFPQYEKQFFPGLPAQTRLERLYLFPDSAAQCFTYRTGTWQPAYDQSFSKEERERILTTLKSALAEVGLAEEPHPVWGSRIEDRGAEIAFSPLGQEAPLAEKEQWHAAHNDLRRALRDTLATDLPECAVATGGLTTIDITRKGVDKAYGILELERIAAVPISEMLYVGDALEEGGNDRAVMRSGVCTRAVADPAETALLIKEILRSGS